MDCKKRAGLYLLRKKGKAIRDCKFNCVLSEIGM